MPAVFVETNVELKNPTVVAQELSKLVAKGLDKPEKYVTVSIRKAQTMTRGGTPTNFAYIEVRSIGGLNQTINDSLAKQIVVLLEKYGLDQSKIDINFIDIAPQNWGKATGIFGKE